MPSKAVVSIFGSGVCGEGSPSYGLALELGARLGAAGYAVATGGYGGVMEAASRGAAENGGHVIGVITSSGPKPNRWVGETVVVSDWQERLYRLIALGSAYVVCGGGTGTLVELAVAWEMICKRLMPRRPLVTLGGFWEPVVNHILSFEEATAARGIVYSASNVDDALRAVVNGSRT